MPLLTDNDPLLFWADHGTGFEYKPEGHNTREYAAAFGDYFKPIPRGEYSDRVREQRERRAAIDQRITWQATQQGNYPTCWAACVAHAFTTARALRGGSVEMVSPMSLAAPISGGRRGGYVGHAIRRMIDVGGVRESIWGPTDTRMHSGPEVNRDCNRLRITKAVEAFDFDQIATAVLLGFPVAGYSDAWGHAFLVVALIEVERNYFALRIRNNWGDGWGDKNEHGVGGFADLGERSRTRVDGGFIVYSTLPSTLEA
jgi:hypothetical protein